MSQRRVVSAFALLACVGPLVHCGSSDSGPGSPQDQGAIPDASQPDAHADGGTSDGATIDVADVAVPDATVSSADSSADASTVDVVGVGDVVDAANAPFADGAVGDAGTAIDASGAADATSDGSPGVIDAAPRAFLCNGQVCGKTEFCGAAGATATADASLDASVDASEDGSADAALDSGDGGSVIACRAAVFANLCDNPTGTVIFDPNPSDNDAVNVIGAAVASACHITIANSPDAGLYSDSGEPTSGIGNLSILTAGAYFQPTISYLDNAGLTDVYLHGQTEDDGGFNLIFTERGPSSALTDLASAPYSTDVATSDYFLLQIVVDPASGSVSLDAFGITAQGTTAAAYYVANYFLANDAYKSSTKSWYLYHWASATDAGVPSSSDVFNVVASGP